MDFKINLELNLEELLKNMEENLETLHKMDLTDLQTNFLLL